MPNRTIVARLSGLVATTLIAATAFASGGGGGGGGGGGTSTLPASGADPTYTAAVDQIQAGHFAEAVTLMEAYVGRSEKNAGDADAQNWLGYAYRRSGNLDAAFLHYDKALAIDPKHRGAHEYMGEAYLMTGNLAQAEEHLKILDGLCWLPCTEYTQLKTAVAAYRVAHADRAATVGAR